VHGEGGVGLEAGHVGRLDQQLGRAQGLTAGQREQLRGVALDRVVIWPATWLIRVVMARMRSTSSATIATSTADTARGCWSSRKLI
jgi:hypothetical protein